MEADPAVYAPADGGQFAAAALQHGGRHYRGKSCGRNGTGSGWHLRPADNAVHRHCSGHVQRCGGSAVSVLRRRPDGRDEEDSGKLADSPVLHGCCAVCGGLCAGRLASPNDFGCSGLSACRRRGIFSHLCAGAAGAVHLQHRFGNPALHGRQPGYALFPAGGLCMQRSSGSSGCGVAWMGCTGCCSCNGDFSDSLCGSQRCVPVPALSSTALSKG